LPYDPNVPTDPEIWGGSFYPILLHSLIKHIASNAKNIKDFLKFMAKYISNKQINLAKANDLDDFNDIGEAVWNLISSVYKANWNVLFTDNNSISLRKKSWPSLLLEFSQYYKEILRKITNQLWLASKGFHCPSQPNLRRRSTLSPSSSKTIKWIIPHCLRLSLTLKPPNRTLAHWMLSRLRKHSHLLERRKSTKLTT